MRVSRLLNAFLLVLGMVFWTVASPRADDAKGKSHKDPAGTSVIMGQLRFLFDKWDLNRDGNLDSDELAKAFRGKDAKAYSGNGKAPTNETAAKFPDYQYLVELDQDRDGKISYREYEDWAHSYAKDQMKQQSSRSSSKKAAAGAGAQSGAAATKAEQQIEKQALAAQKQQLYYLQEIQKQLRRSRR